MRTEKLQQLAVHALLIGLVVLMLYPVVFAVFNSFKTQSEIYTNILGLLPHNPTVENYARINQQIDYWHIVGNTFTVALVVMVFKTVTSFMVAYAFVYLRFPGKNILYFILVSTMFIPFTMTMIPNYITISKLGLIDSIYGIILPQLSDAMGIFLMRQQMRSIPKSFFEVARLEKMPHPLIMGRIVLPTIRPAVISISIIFLSTPGMNLSGRSSSLKAKRPTPCRWRCSVSWATKAVLKWQWRWPWQRQR